MTDPTRCARCRQLALVATLLASLPLASIALAADAASFTDPAPPTVATLPPQAPAEPKDNPDATFRAAPKPLPAGAVTGDWLSFLGPHHNLVCDETKLLPKFPKAGPAIVWEVKRGSGYSAPAVVGERLVMIHRVGDKEVVDCLQATTGKRYWRFDYPTAYADRYGYCDGPRATPVISGTASADGKDEDRRVYTIGAEGKLHCLDLATGRLVWARDLLKEFKCRQNFFGVGSTPLVEGDKLIVNVGAPAGPCVAAFDLKTGRMLWGAGDAALGWGPSYASPVPATVYGKRRVFVFAGGETHPGQAVAGGLLCLDPNDGHVDFTFPWRGNRRESVNASTPLVLTDRDPPQVFISECYGTGGALLDIAPDLTAKPAWTNDSFGTHFMTAVHRDGYLYGVDGHGPNDAFLVCVDRKTGKEVWRTQPEWKERAGALPGAGGEAAGGGREFTVGTYRCHLMPVDGRYLCLGEYGHLLWVDLTPQGYKELDRAWLFAAAETWTPPVVSRGLLYVCQNTDGRVSERGPRLLCYDLRAGG